jgi:pimeloyl-ACP methyl ester carboxylesterase
MNSGGAKMHFAVSGSGDIPLICTHGWACNGEQFIELSRLLAKDFRIFRPDLPGHGLQPTPNPSFTGEIEETREFRTNPAQEPVESGVGTKPVRYLGGDETAGGQAEGGGVCSRPDHGKIRDG